MAVALLTATRRETRGEVNLDHDDERVEKSWDAKPTFFLIQLHIRFPSEPVPRRSCPARPRGYAGIVVVERRGRVISVKRVSDGGIARGPCREVGKVGCLNRREGRESQLDRNSVAVFDYDEGVGICADAPYWKGNEYA